jgi:hypothetical protein
MCTTCYESVVVRIRFECQGCLLLHLIFFFLLPPAPCTSGGFLDCMCGFHFKLGILHNSINGEIRRNVVFRQCLYPDVIMCSGCSFDKFACELLK